MLERNSHYIVEYEGAKIGEMSWKFEIFDYIKRHSNFREKVMMLRLGGRFQYV